LPHPKIYATLLAYIFYLYTMSFESPEQVDLSKQDDITKLKASLTEAEQKSLDAFLVTEREWILVMTRDELQELKNILAWEGLNSLSQNIQSGTIEGDLDIFMQNQIKEWVSSSDILWETEILSSEELDTIDIQSQNILFGNEWVFSGIDISSKSKDNLSTALTLSIIDQLTSKDTITKEDIQAILDWESIISEQIQSNLDSLKVQTSEMTIAWGWDMNYIFSQTSTWATFFNELFTGAIAEADIIARIEEQNIDENSELPIDIQNDLSEIAKNTWENIASIQGKIEQALKDAGGNGEGEMPDIIPDSEVELTWIAKIIRDILQAISEGLVGFWEFFWIEQTEKKEEWVTLAEEAPAEEVAPTNIEQWRNLFRTKLSEWNISPFAITQMKELFPEEWELTETAKKIISSMEEIPTLWEQDTLEEKFNNLFWNREGKETSKFEEFVDASGIDTSNKDNLTWDYLKQVIEKYLDYRKNWKEVLYSVWFKNNASQTSENN